MAGGMEWSRSVQPLLTSSHSILDKNDIPEIITTIIKSESDILEHEDQYEQFYSSFVALATHYLSHSLSAVPKTSWNNMYQACKILIKYLLDRLQNYNEGCAITQKMQMFLLKSLCTGTSSISKTDISTFTAILKFAKVPSIIRSEKDTDTMVTQQSQNRSRLDIGTDLFDQLTSAFNDLSTTKPQKSDTGEEEITDAEVKDEMKEEMKMTFGKRNLNSLQQLDGGVILVDVCSRLTFLGRYKERYRDAIGGVSFILPNTLSEALTMRNSFLPLLNEISIVWRAFSLPILEPLTPKRLENIVTVMMSCLYASLSVAVTNSVIAMTSTTPVKPATGKEEENENYGCSIIQKSLEIFSIVTNAVKNSTRAGGNVAQNVNLMAAWLLLKGLQNILFLTPAVILERKDSAKQKDTKGKESRPCTATKSSFQGFGAVSVALSTKALHLIQELMNDLQLEGFYQDMGVSHTSSTGLEFPIMQSQTAWRRVQKLLNNIPLMDLLFSLVTTSFKKACLLRRLKLGSENSETSSSSASDSITFYEDDFSSSEDSSEEEEEDGSDSILGHWMEETMCPSESPDTQAPPPVPARVDGPGEGKRSRKISSGDSPVFIPDKREPAGFVNLAAELLNFINIYFVSTSDTELQKTLKNCLNEDHMNNLSTVIKELDKETIKVGADKTFENLSISLARLNHSLIATGCLSDRLQDVLLEQLNVSPSSVDPWPLTVHPRTLSVLAEVILLKQQKERESKTLKSQSEAAVIHIWVRFMTTLKSAIINFDNNTDTCEDVNVEHLQLLIFLFHSLPLMQKKSLWMQLAQNIIAISELDQKKLEKMVPLLLSRMMLIFEYLLHYFYDPPEELMDQVRWNLFTVHTMKQEGDKQLSALFYPWDDVEERYRKNLTSQESNEVQKPRFYNIGPIEIRSQDAPKVDGLACSFLLASPDSISYNLLYDACIMLLMVGSRVDKYKPKLTLLDSVSRHSHFLISWRLLACLPPSIQYLKLLETGTLQMSNGHVLHTLRWTPRCGQKVFINWIKDCLVKQGLTTQQSDALLTNVNKLANTVNFDIRLAMNFIQDQIAVLPLVDITEILPVEELPSLFSCLMLDCVIAKVQVSLDETFAKAMDDIDPNKTMEIAQDLIPATLLLLEAYGVFARSCILGKLQCEDDGDLQVTSKQLNAYGAVMSIGSTNHSTVMLLAREIMATLPRKLWQAIDKWVSSTTVVFPGNASWKGDYSNDLVPGESYIEAILSSHIETMSAEVAFSVDLSIRHMLSSLVRFASDLTTWCPDTNSSKEMVRVMFPLTVEAAAVYMDHMVWMSLERFLGPADGDEYLEKTFFYCISVCYNLIVNYSEPEYGLEEKVLVECLKFMENHIESKAERKAFEKFFTVKGDLTTLLLSATKKNLSSQFSTYVLKFLNKLLSLAEKNPTDTSYEVICGTLSKLTDIDKSVLQSWLSKMIISSQVQEEEEKILKENRMLLRNITMYIVKEKSSVSETVALCILSAMIPMGEVILSKEKDTSSFPELMSVMQTLAGAGQGIGHTTLFPATTEWLEICNQQLSEQEVLDSLTDSSNKRKAILDTISFLLSYIGDILSALKRNSEKSGVLPSDDTETTTILEADSDWTEDIAQEDEDSAAEDSDEESLNNKLCTFTVTQKEFMNQHWYHCHDCKMVEGVGVCTVCAKVCHKGHDLTYAKFGSFFCDCGAKDDTTCKALAKRSPQSGMDANDNMSSQSPFSMDNTLPSSLRRRMSGTGMTEKTSTNKVAEQVNKAREALCKQVEGCQELLLNHLEQSQTVKTVLTMLETILPTLTENYQKVSPTGSTKRAQKALHDLHHLPKTTENTENLMTVTLGSQEGAFENVRMNYSGDQGQTIRQLITAHMIRRIAMCVLASPHGKRQHLAVSHEKGKITILQLSALLKQADSSKKKLTLTRLASAPIPFTVLSIAGNPCNEDLLVVCGLKDCHVLTFTSAGSVSDHLVLHPTLTTGNFIIKAIWLPGTQTELAIVTADFVKIYNLGCDALSPQYFFLLPSGKIRDATFVTTEQGCHMVLMASTGYIYTQVLEETSSAKHGPFYITNVLEVNHDDLKETNGNVAGGGVSVYYSHALQLLFFSYSQGKSLAATVTKDLSRTPMLFQISLKINGTSKGTNNNQPLVQWSEVPGHVGLMYCMTQSTNNPVVLMIKPDIMLVQEIKVVPAKAKIQDVVAIRHTASNSDQQQRTTMILLCEDGSLRIYMANTENTNYWLSPYLQPQSPISVLKPAKKKKVARSGHVTGSVSFPVDFFEHCYQTNDVEFGGNDLLQLYNTQQIKHRLTAIGMYVASTKPAGFTIEISNTNATNVMVGLRVQVGTQSVERVPSYLEIFSRSVPVTVTKSRWYDLPFTREEAITADKKVTLFVGASADPAGVTMVDSIKVYVKTKESFGWPEETDEFPEASTTKNIPQQQAQQPQGQITVTESETVSFAPLPLTCADRLLGSALEVLDGAFVNTASNDKQEPTREKALKIATQLLTLPTPPSVQQHTKSLMASLFPNTAAYYNHKDQAQLVHVMDSLSKEETDLDVEAYQRLLVTARSVAVSRGNNLVKFAEKGTSKKEEVLEVTDLEEEKEVTASWSVSESKETRHFITMLTEAFWKLHSAKPSNPMLAPVCLPGLSHVDATVSALVEIINAFTLCDLDTANLATKLYVKFLMSPVQTVSFACKQAIIRSLRPRHRRRRVFIPSPPRCSSPGGGDDNDDNDDQPDHPDDKPVARVPAPTPPTEQEADEAFEVVEHSEPMDIEQAVSSHGRPIGLEELLSGGVNFPPMVDIPPDADDETMVELAIALSLQDQPGSGSLGLQGLRLAAAEQIDDDELEQGPLSDTTASAPGSDDENGSNAATDGSTLRTSPAEHAGSGGSDSGGSAPESISGDQNISGRSSVYGDKDRETGGRSETSSVGMPSTSLHQEADSDYDATQRLHSLRLILLERLLQYLPEVREVGGVRAIPFMQVLLMLTSDLDSEEEKDKAALDTLLTALIKELDLSGQDLENVSGRTKSFEFKLVLLRLLSVLLSRTKAGTKSSGESSSFISNMTASALVSSGAINYCLTILKNLLPYWKQFSSQESDGSPVTGCLLKPHPSHPPPDMSPFFLRQYVKGHASDVFEDYPQLLTEMVLRLPYQIKKISENNSSVTPTNFDSSWNNILSEYMMTQQTPFVKRQVRKLLMFICGTREKYRELRDLHAVEMHLNNVMKLCKDGGLPVDQDILPGIILPYDTLLSIIEHLKACLDVATSRPMNWQLYCKDNQNIMSFLVRASIMLDEGVASTLLQLLQCALCGSKTGTSITEGPGSSTSPAKQKKDKDKDKNEDSDDGQKIDETLCLTLIELLNKVVEPDLMIKFIRTFLLESNSTTIRWQAHSLIFHIYKNYTLTEQENLMEMMWSLWKELALYGRKAAQFVDLLGYFVLKTPQTSEKKTKEYLEKAISVLRDENHLLANHPNAQIYNMLQGLVDFDGYYLESDPCLVCNNPEVPYSIGLKLSAIKVDSKFTTTTQIIKLVGSHNISKITLRISDLKRTKMVRVINFYYNNRTVQAVVELKNKPGLWHKAKKVTLTSGQTDVKVEFPIPIVACNLMIEYADFYDNLQATAETLQCPRCSASVPATPGVCGNCGENVFQCHKCRAINYDEKDPFLCNACGFCKYAKFDYTLTARQCCAVDPIENEEDRQKAITTINTLLEKADRIYKNLQQHRPLLEKLLIQVTEHGSERLDDALPPSGGGSATVPSSNVNKAIQSLAQKYCSECKSSFDELSKIIQKVLACRRELVEYDCQQREAVSAASQASPVTSPRDKLTDPMLKAKAMPPCKPKMGKDSGKSSNCYGCASAAVEHCITLLRALVTNTNLRQILCGQGMIKELIDYNLRHGSLQVRNEVRSLLCLLTKDNRRGTEEMNNLVMTRISSALKGYLSNPDLGSSVRHEILLLATSLQQEDTCWEQRIRCVMRLFVMGMQMKNPVITDCVTLPCLRILQHLIKPTVNNKENQPPELPRNLPADLHVNSQQWLKGDPKHSFQNWRKILPKKAKVEKPEGEKSETKPDQEEAKKVTRALYLMEKYVGKWRQKMSKTPAIHMKLAQTTWLQQAMFSLSSRSARQTACNIIESIAQIPNRKKEVIDMLTKCLDGIGKCGECSSEYLTLYKRLIQPAHWKYYLAIKGVMLHLGDLITNEVEHLLHLEETTLSSDLAQGFALKSLTELLSQIVEQDILKQHYKNKLVGYVLNGYLSLRKLVVQRTKLIDDTQDKLLELLEELTSGTESETKEFMQVCVKTVKKYPADDYRSPVFIFERLCSIIFPEENDVEEFLLILEKDPQQEDFLQGRMLGNPYSCNEPGLGPLMRDVKNKICQDCELVALLEDDNGMELLVNKKIISLDLPVKEVYKKVWAPEHGEGEPMPIIYRMRGLLGDATEDMVNSLDSNAEEDVDKEEVYKMAIVLSEGDGLKVMLERLASIKDLVLGKQLMTVLLKLFSYTVNVKANRLELLKPEMNTLTVMLGALNLALWAEQESGTSATKGQTITEQVLQIMEVILLEASNQPTEKFREFSKMCGDKGQLMLLLDRINSPFVRSNSSVLQELMRLIPFMAFGDEEKMTALINHFKPYLDFAKFDLEHTQDETIHLDCFCVIAAGIENNENGNKLKDMILDNGIVKLSVDYILKNSPPIKTLLPTDVGNWKEFLEKPSLSYILRLLTGLCAGHTPTQLSVGSELIAVLHKLEQASSDQHIGTEAENLLEALSGNEKVSEKIEEVRQQTKSEKKKRAMAKREKQLGALGMMTNEKGQVTVKSSVLKQMEDIKEETGLTCCICREGYRCQPQKVLAIYTFTKRVNLDDYENKPRKAIGYSTVSHFNVIHVDCHTAAVRHARGREEWESAALQNANTKCNGLLPLWGPQVQESAFATCLARHNTYIQDCTGIRDPSYPYNIHDVKHLLLKFAQEKSFSEDSGGGGRQSNMHVLPAMIHMALYVINTTRSVAREEKNFNNFITLPQEKWVESSYETEGALYWTVMAFHIHPVSMWKDVKIELLKRLLILAQTRHLSSGGTSTLTDKALQEYSVYKPYFVFFGLVDMIYNNLFKKVVVPAEGTWSNTLADYIRNNDKPLIENCDKVLRSYEDELLPCESVAEMLDVLGLLSDIPDPAVFLTDLLSSMP